MAKIDVPRNTFVRVSGSDSGGGMPQAFDLNVIYQGTLYPLASRLPGNTRKEYRGVAVDYVLEVRGGHYRDGAFRYSKEQSTDPKRNPVTLSYDDSGGNGSGEDGDGDYDDLIITVQRTADNEVADARRYNSDPQIDLLVAVIPSAE